MSNKVSSRSNQGIDDAWQMYTDGILTREELDESRKKWGLKDNWLQRAIAAEQGEVGV